MNNYAFILQTQNLLSRGIDPEVITFLNLQITAVGVAKPGMRAYKK
jgi:hypothetical protein